MDGESITCQFIFTARQYASAMRCWWQHSWMKWFGLAGALFILGSEITDDINASSLKPITIWSVAEDFIPLIIVSAFVVGLMYLTFRRSAYYRKEITYTFHEGGVHVHSPLAETELKWAIYARATESRRGFALYQLGKGSFNWVPKLGFAGPGEIDRCRELIRTHVKDTKRLLP